MKVLNTGDRRFVLNTLMPEFGLKRVNFDFSGSQGSYPDIWCLPNESPPVIVVTKEWRRQSTPERRKRLTHEFLHFAGMEHNEKTGYSTYPNKDTYSMKVYQILTRNPMTVERYRRKFDVPYRVALDEVSSMFPGKVTGRIKSADSIREKIKKKGISVTQLTDIAGLMVVFPTLKDLYRGLIELRSKYEVIDERDYISYPKAGYRSYHLLVKVMDRIIEVQLKTTRMKEWQEIGHEKFYKKHEGLSEVHGTRAVKKMEEHMTKISEHYARKDIGAPSTRPRTPRAWKLAGLPVFLLNPIMYSKRGECYEWAWRYQDVKGGTLIHGTFWSTPLNNWMAHAWVELDDGVNIYEPTTDSIISKAWFMRNLKPKNLRRYTPGQAREWMIKSMNYGPWKGETGYFVPMKRRGRPRKVEEIR